MLYVEVMDWQVHAFVTGYARRDGLPLLTENERHELEDLRFRYDVLTGRVPAVIVGLPDYVVRADRLKYQLADDEVVPGENPFWSDFEMLCDLTEIPEEKVVAFLYDEEVEIAAAGGFDLDIDHLKIFLTWNYQQAIGAVTGVYESKEDLPFRVWQKTLHIPGANGTYN